MTDSDDLGQTPENEGSRLSEGTRRTADRLVAGAGETYGKVSDVARAGYDATTTQVAAWPMSSLLVAVGIGFGLGWAMRGSIEEDSRKTWLQALYENKRLRSW